jgi:hypothetical protein
VGVNVIVGVGGSLTTASVAVGVGRAACRLTVPKMTTPPIANNPKTNIPTKNMAIITNNLLLVAITVAPLCSI